MSEYTPTTEFVRSVYEKSREEAFEWEIATSEELADEGSSNDERFNRWLAAVERAAAEKAWDEGREHGFNEGRDYFAFGHGCGPDTWDCDCPNPYRRNEGENE